MGQSPKPHLVKGVIYINKKYYKLSFRADERLYNTVITNAIKLKISKSKYITNCLTNKKITVIDNVNEVVYQLKKIGNNINQIARANYVYGVDNTNYSELAKEMKNIWQLLNSLTSKKEI